MSDPRPNAIRHAFPGILLTAGLLIYLNSLTNPFTFDDIRGIVENPAIRQLAPPTWATDVPLGTIAAGRPTVGLSLAVNHAVGGLNVVGYRVVNLAIHLGCGLLLFGLVRRTLHNEPHYAAGAGSIAFATALLWLVHPLQSECINYISQRTTSLMALCYLGTMYTALRGRDGAIGWSVAAVAICAAGMASKPVMVSAPLMVLLYDALFSPHGTVTRRRGFYAALATTWLISFGLLRAFPDVTIGSESDTSSWQYALNQCQVIPGYLWHTFVPYPLVFDYGYPRDLALADVWSGGVLILGLLALALYLLWTHPKVGFVAIWLFVILGPTSSFVPIATEVGAERRMYLALAGPLLLLTLLLHRWMPSTNGSRFLVPIIVVSIVWSAMTVLRNVDYTSGLRIWETAVATRSDNPRARANYSQELLDVGRVDEALTQARAAVELQPSYSVGQYALGRVLQTTADRAGALTAYEAALAADPTLENAAINMHQLRVEAALTRGALDEAEASVNELKQRLPGNPNVLLLGIDVLLGRGQRAAAEQQLRAVLAQHPNDAFVHLKLTDTLLLQEKWTEAREAIAPLLPALPEMATPRQQIANDPKQPAGYLALAQQQFMTGERWAALGTLRFGATQVEPNRAIQQRLAWFLVSIESGPEGGREALRIANELRTQRPDDPRAAELLAAAHAHSGDFTAAIQFAEQARAGFAGNREGLDRIDKHLAVYRSGHPLRVD